MSETKNNECAVARDLIPLYIDGAASPETSGFVKKHLEGCPECAAYAAALKEAPRGMKMAENDRRDFAAIARRMKRRVLRRFLLATLAGALLAAALFSGFMELWAKGSMNMPLQHYTAAVYRLKDGGDVLVLADRGTRRLFGWGHSTPDSRQTMYISEYTSVIPRPGSGKTRVELDFDLNVDQIGAIVRQGPKGEESAVWRKGDPVPAASAELEKYVALYKEKELKEFSESHPWFLSSNGAAAEAAGVRGLENAEQTLDELQNEVPEFRLEKP